MQTTQRPPFVDFRAVKAQVTMEQILTRYNLIDKLKRSGDSLSGTCPIHNGTNPTQFRVSVAKNCWNCFGDCRAGGNVLDFVARMENCGVRDAAYKLAEWFGLTLTARDSAPPARGRPTTSAGPGAADAPAPAPLSSADGTPAGPPIVASPAPGSPSAPTAPATEPEAETNKPLGFTLRDLDGKHPYLAERGLSPETVATFGLGLCNAGTMIGRIAIPMHNARGELVGYVGRWAGTPPGETPKYKLPKGFRKSAEVFNLWRAAKEPPEQPLVIVEGVFDVMKLWQAGARKVVALLGSTLSPVQENLIRVHFRQGSRILVMLDEDEAGRSGRQEIVLRLASCAYVKIHSFGTEGRQPEHLSPPEIEAAVNT